MTDPFEDFTPTGSEREYEDVLDAYMEADDPYVWLRNEIAMFLAVGGETDAVNEQVDMMLDTLGDREQVMLDTMLDEDDLLAFEVQVIGEHIDTRMMFREVPHPVELLWVLTQNAEPGDTVMTTHHFTGSTAVAQLAWPFDVDTATLATTPNPREAYPHVDDDDDQDSYTDTGIYDQDSSVGVEVALPVTAFAVGAAAVLCGIAATVVATRVLGRPYNTT